MCVRHPEIRNFGRTVDSTGQQIAPSGDQAELRRRLRRVVECDRCTNRRLFWRDTIGEFPERDGHYWHDGIPLCEAVIDDEHPPECRRVTWAFTPTIHIAGQRRARLADMTFAEYLTQLIESDIAVRGTGPAQAPPPIGSTRRPKGSHPVRLVLPVDVYEQGQTRATNDQRAFANYVSRLVVADVEQHGDPGSAFNGDCRTCSAAA